ncbi:MAG TPA: DUF222 domain-containing protein, partial [Streptosporangiaceae bacterium]
AGADSHLAEHVGDELAVSLTLTGRAADALLDFACELARLPLTAAALASGTIDRGRARVIADELGCLDPAHAVVVEAQLIGRAGRQTTGQLRAAARRAVLAADPAAANRRCEKARKRARVEIWDEGTGGTAALAGRDLPPSAVLAADKRIDTLARHLRAAGADGTMDQLRAQVYVALLLGHPIDPATTPAARDPSTGNLGEHDPGTDDSPLTGGADGSSTPAGPPGNAVGAPGNAVGAPGNAVGVPGNAVGSRGSAAAPPRRHAAGLSQPGGQTAGAGNTGRADRHGAGGSPRGGCIPDAGDGLPPGLVGSPGAGDGVPPVGRAGTLPGGPRSSVNLTMPLSAWLGISAAPGEAAGFGPIPATDARALANLAAAQPGTRWCLTFTDHTGRAIAHGCAHQKPRGRETTGPPGDWELTVTIRPIATSDCAHLRETARYRASPSLAHIVNIRQRTCSFPGCRRQATKCDLDHTIPYDQGGRTCQCNLATLCRRHHRAKQAQGWHLEQPQPGVLVWRAPHGRTYLTEPDLYPEE